MNPNVDRYLLDGCMRCKYGGTPQCKVHTWQYELDLLRTIALQTSLIEEIKWGMPTYTCNNKNVIMIAAFKNYCSINFFKGALIPDTYELFTKKDKPSADRHIAFTNVQQIEEAKQFILEYITRAIEIEDRGEKIIVQRKDIEPTELLEMFEEDTRFRQAFYALTKGRQRAYIIYFSQPKQSKTKIQRIEKYRNMILQGIGLNDHYSKKTYTTIL